MNYSGLVVAAIGFFLTRFTVTLALYDDPLRFYFAGVVPLLLGLGLAAFGVALAVGDVDRSLVRSTAAWCVVGTGVMLVLVLLTLLGLTSGDMPDLAAVQSRPYLANFLIGGSVGGTLTGLYAARNRRQRRALRQYANRLEVLNRMLRHEVLNSLTAIQGYAALRENDGDAREVIERRVNAIQDVIEEVKYLTWRTGEGGRTGVSVALGPCLEASVDDVRDRHPAAEVRLADPSQDLHVAANERIEQVFTHLLENAILHSEHDRPTATVSVTSTPTSVRVAIADDGPGLPDEQQRLLELGDIGKFDDAKTGFGLNVVRLLGETYGGSFETEVRDDGTTVTVVLPRAADAGTGLQPTPRGVAAVRVSAPRLVVTVGAALVAGLLMGLAGNVFGGVMPVVGALYGVQSEVVGWIAHEFHSVVFGFIYAGLLAAAPERFGRSLWRAVALAAGWGLVLALFAAGVIMPFWLQLVGIPATVPSISPTAVSTHLVWGVTLGITSVLGYRHVAPWLSTSWERLRSRVRFGPVQPASGR